MKINENGIERDMTAEEIAAMEKLERNFRIAENNRPLTEAEVTRMLLTAQVNSLSVDDRTALRMKEFYPEWELGASYAPGFKVLWNGKLWRAVQAHGSQEGWEPEKAASLWEQIDETHAGTLEDPIPYDGNMALESGKYYIQAAALYRCILATGAPIHHPLAALLGLYVEEV